MRLLLNTWKTGLTIARQMSSSAPPLSSKTYNLFQKKDFHEVFTNEAILPKFFAAILGVKHEKFQVFYTSDNRVYAAADTENNNISLVGIEYSKRCSSNILLAQKNLENLANTYEGTPQSLSYVVITEENTGLFSEGLNLYKKDILLCEPPASSLRGMENNFTIVDRKHWNSLNQKHEDAASYWMQFLVAPNEKTLAHALYPEIYEEYSTLIGVADESG